MTSTFFIQRWLLLCLCGVLLSGCASSGVRPLSTKEAQHDFGLVLATVQKNYVDEVDVDALVDDAIGGMYLYAGVAPLSDAELKARSSIKLTDPLQRFALNYDYLLKHAAPPSVNAVQSKHDKHPAVPDQVDIGVRLALSGEWIRIAAVIIDSPAEAAGLNRGDAIIAINGQSTDGKSLSWCYQQLSGAEGTVVDVMVYTEEGDEAEYRIVRARIITPSIVLLRLPRSVS